jgi:type I restriction enzyme S subunit
MTTVLQKIDLNILDKSTWESFRFEEITNRVAEGVDPNTTTLEKYVGLEHIDADNIHIKRFGTPDDVSGGKLKCYPGNVIFGKRRAYQRKAAIVDFEGICSAHAFVFRANPEVIDPKLFPFFLHSDQFMHRAVDISVGGLSPTINWGDLKGQEFLLPPKAEQARLAELLWAIEEVVEKDKAVLAKIFAIKKVLSDNYFNPIRHSDKMVTLAKVSKLTTGGTPNTEKKEYWEGGNIPWLSSGEVHKKVIHYTDNFITDQGLKKSSAKLMPPKTIFIALAGQGKTKGTVAISEIETCTNQSVAAIIPNIEKIEPYYLYYNLDSRYLDFRHITGKENSRTGLNLKILNDFKIVVHDKKERKKILDKCIVLDENINSIENKIKNSQSLKKSIINQMF